MFARPLTGSVSPALVTIITLHAPIHAEEHLVQAWEAISTACRGEKERENIAFARNRLACARSEPVARAVKPRQRKAYEAECASLEAALKDYVL